jgi:hypothetical protein
MASWTMAWRQTRELCKITARSTRDQLSIRVPGDRISGYLGGMPVAILAGRAPELFADPLGLRPVPEHNIVLAGALSTRLTWPPGDMQVPATA